MYQCIQECTKIDSDMPKPQLRSLTSQHVQEVLQDLQTRLQKPADRQSIGPILSAGLTQCLPPLLLSHIWPQGRFLEIIRRISFWLIQDIINSNNIRGNNLDQYLSRVR